MQKRKRILSVTVRRIADESPDTSMLGEYSRRPESEYAIDRAHSQDCASVVPANKEAQQTLINARGTVADLQSKERADTQEWEALEDAYNLLDSLAEGLQDCDCGEHGDAGRNEYRYFNPNWQNYIGTEENIRKYTRQDYERMESLNRGDWCYIGIRAQAQVVVSEPANCLTRRNLSVASGIVQTITSAGLWGVESDSDREYLELVEEEELADLKSELKSLGFSSRAISTAFKNIERKGE